MKTTGRIIIYLNFIFINLTIQRDISVLNVLIHLENLQPYSRLSQSEHRGRYSATKAGIGLQEMSWNAAKEKQKAVGDPFVHPDVVEKGRCKTQTEAQRRSSSFRPWLLQRSTAPRRKTAALRALSYVPAPRRDQPQARSAPHYSRTELTVLKLPPALKQRLKSS